MPTPASAPSPRRNHAFTFIELLIVMAMLMVVAALVVPQFSNAGTIARENSLRDDLRLLRTQIAVYAAQHNGVAPGYPDGNTDAAPTEAAVVNQLVGYTNDRGQSAAMPDDQFRFGPYIRKIPDNPFNLKSTFRIIGPGAFPTHAAGTHGWIYQPSSGQIAADATGHDASGLEYFQY